VHLRALRDPATGGEALDAALVLDPLLVTRGPIDHVIALLDQGLAAAPADHPKRLDALESRANALRYVRLDEARAAYEELERQATSSRRHLGRAFSGKGIVRLLAQDLGGEADLERALAIQRELGDTFGELVSEASLGHLALRRNDLAVARERFGRSLALAVQLRDPRNEGLQRGNIGLVEQECGRLLVARDAFERAVDVFRSLEDRRSEAWARSNLAAVAQEQGLLDEARALYRETLARHEEVGNRRAMGIVLAHIARIEQWDGAYDRAHELCQQALAVLEASGATAHHALVTAMHGGVLADLGLRDAARSAFERAEGVLAATDDHVGLAALEVSRGHLDLALDNPAAAKRRLVEALANVDRWSVRFARIGLERALERAGSSQVEPTRSKSRPYEIALVVGPDARWFRSPGGAKVDLTRRRQLRLILSALAAARREQPGRALTVEALLASGWPGESVLAEAGASRVYVAVSTLRRMGLRDVLQRQDTGYLIDPDVPVVSPGD
jgi:tetratricopeptide (TPR) repeat protein